MNAKEFAAEWVLAISRSGPGAKSEVCIELPNGEIHEVSEVTFRQTGQDGKIVFGVVVYDDEFDPKDELTTDL